MAPSWPTREQKARVNRLMFIKDRLDLRMPPTSFEATLMENDLKELPTAAVSEGQIVKLTELDADIVALDPAWVPGDVTKLVDREHASNKISQLQGIVDRLFAKANADVDVLAVYSRGNGGRFEEVDEADVAF